MHLKEIFIHRLRDFDAAFRSDKKATLFNYILLRTFCKIFGSDENKLTSQIPSSTSSFNRFKFFSREKTLDFLFYSRYYEPETTKYIGQNRGNIFLDVGSHIGRFAVLSSKNFKQVIAFEANPFNFSVLKKNVVSNNIKNVSLVNKALSGKKQALFLEMPQLNTGASKISSSGNIKVLALKLDDYLAQKRLHPREVSLVLMDVEGHEEEILNGAKNFLSQTSSSLIIECFNPNKIEKFLSRYGYKRKKVLDFYNYLFVKV